MRNKFPPLLRIKKTDLARMKKCQVQPKPSRSSIFVEEKKLYTSQLCSFSDETMKAKQLFCLTVTAEHC